MSSVLMITLSFQFTKIAVLSELEAFYHGVCILCGETSAKVLREMSAEKPNLPKFTPFAVYWNT